MATILIIDDNADVLLMMTHYLTRRGHTVRTASNGVAGLAVAQQKPLDLIVCDLLMPGMSGYEVVARLKQDPRLGHIPVVAATALEGVDKAKMLAAGFDALVTKPFRGSTLVREIEALLS